MSGLEVDADKAGLGVVSLLDLADDLDWLIHLLMHGLEVLHFVAEDVGQLKQWDNVGPMSTLSPIQSQSCQPWHWILILNYLVDSSEQRPDLLLRILHVQQLVWQQVQEVKLKLLERGTSLVLANNVFPVFLI